MRRTDAKPRPKPPLMPAQAVSAAKIIVEDVIGIGCVHARAIIGHNEADMIQAVGAQAKQYLRAA